MRLFCLQILQKTDTTKRPANSLIAGFLICNLRAILNFGIKIAGDIAFSKKIVMKKLLILSLFSLCYMYADAESSDSTLTEKNIREKILGDIQQNLAQKNEQFDSTIVKLDRRVSKLDSTIKMTGNPKERIDKLVERVQILEESKKP